MKAISLPVPGYIYATSIRGNRNILVTGNRQEFGIDTPLPMTKNTKFDLASLTKIVGTTIAIASLIDSKDLRLTDRISTYFAEWVDSEKASITVTDLLTHQSGLAEWYPLYFDCSSSIVAQIDSIPLKYPINSGRRYSDLGFITLGEVIKSITDMPLEIALNELVFKPLGMKNTFYGPVYLPVAATSLGDQIEKEMIRSNSPYEVNLNIADYPDWRTDYLVGETNDGNAFHRLNGVSGHAGLFSEIDDLLIYAEALLSNTWQVNSFMTESGDPMQGLGFRNWRQIIDGHEITIWGHTGFTGVVLGVSLEHQSAAILLPSRLHVQGKPTPTEDLWEPFLRAFCTQIVI